MATGFPVKANYATGDVLTAANMNDLSGTVNYLQYMPPRNPIINSNFSVWQRGTSFTAADVYTADRWRKDSQTYSTLTRQTTSDTTNLPTIQYCARVARNSGQTGTSSLGLIYTAETVDAIKYAGQAVVVSFYARAGATYSAASSALNYNFYTGTGTDQSRSFGAGFTGEANIASSTKTLTTTWQRFSFTATIGATATEWALMFYFNGVGTAGATDYFEITGVQLELGSVANTYMPNQPTYQGELAACQRYYWRNTANNNETLINYGFAAPATYGAGIIQYPVTMRTIPTSLDYSNVKFANYAGSGYAMSSLTFNQASVHGAQIYGTVSGASNGQVGTILGSASGAYVGMSAEL